MAAPAVYIVCGHGHDMCDPVTHVPIRQQLPAGVTVLERAVCGAYTADSDIKQLIAKITDPANLATVQQVDPAAIRALLGIMGIHRADSANAITSSMVRSQIIFLLDWVDFGRIRIEPSGLIKVPLQGSLPPAIDWTDPLTPLPRARFLSMYANSVYPTQDDMDRALRGVGIYGDIPWDMYRQHRRTLARLEELLPITEVFPGVYYHIVCREVDPSCEENAIASRAESGSGTGRSPEDIKINGFDNLIIRHLSGESGISELVAALPYSDFVIFFEKFLVDTPVILRGLVADPLCDRQVNLYGLIRQTIFNTSNPVEQYRPQFYKAIDICRPGSTDKDKSDEFERLKTAISQKPAPLSIAEQIADHQTTIDLFEKLISRSPELRAIYGPMVEAARKKVADLKARQPAPPPAPAPPPPDRPLQVNDRVRIINTDNPIRRAERFIILRRPLPTDLSKNGVRIGPEAWMCEEVDSKKVVAIRESNLTLAPIQQGGALWPPKYYKGLSTRRKRQRYREITHRKKLSWKDPKAYRPFKTDRAATQRKPSSYTSRFHAKYPGVTGIPAIAKATGVSAGTLHKVYNRGMAAWRTGHRPGASQEAWGMARVYSFVLHGKTWRTADKDLASK